MPISRGPFPQVSRVGYRPGLGTASGHVNVYNYIYHPCTDFEMNFNCSMCHFSTQHYQRYYRHVIRLHKHDPHFIVQCCINSCSYSTKSWNAYKIHVCRKHKHFRDEIIEHGAEDTDDNLYDNGNSNEEEDVDIDTSLQKAFCNARFLLQLESNYNLPKVAIDSVVSSVSLLVESHQASYRKQLKAALVEQGVSETDFDNVHIQSESMFDIFQTEHMRQKFYSTYCQTDSPQEVLLGTVTKLIKGKIRQVQRLGYIIPLFDSLQSLFDMPEIQHYLEKPHYSTNEYMFDLCDGKQMTENPLYRKNPNAIQIILNTDDIEVVNPLGSHVKTHKLSMFYYTLGNIPPQFRSKLSSIQLLAVARTVDTKRFGIEQLLSDFVTSVNILASGGKFFDIGNITKNVEGTVFVAPCDTPAAAFLGGFKEGVGFAYKTCRSCDISPDNVNTQFSSNSENLRSPHVHKERCATLENLSRETKQYWSKMWGINGTSVLSKISNLDVPMILVHDPMHILLEGIIQHELRLFLFYCTQSQKYFSLKWLNSRIKAFQYTDHDRKNRPQVIDARALKPGGRIKQTAIEMYTLLCLLPFLVGSKITHGDERWVNVLHLLQITLLSCSSCVSKTSAFELQQIVYTYLENFKKCYPKASFIPKMHYLTHFPQQILNFGPLRNLWCMRFEGKHGFFKKIKWTNFKNLPLSVANRHQQWMSYKQLGHNGRRSENFLYDGDKVPNGQEILISDVFPELIDRFDQNEGYLVPEVNIHGNLYKRGQVVVIGVDNLPPTPSLGVVKDIIIVNYVKYFVLAELEILDFDEHMNSYIVEETVNKDVVKYGNLMFKWPENTCILSDRKYLMLRNCPILEPLI